MFLSQLLSEIIGHHPRDFQVHSFSHILNIYLLLLLIIQMYNFGVKASRSLAYLS